MKIAAFGVLKNTPQGAVKPAPVCIAEINDKLAALGVTAENVVNIFVDDGLYHVFYKI